MGSPWLEKDREDKGVPGICDLFGVNDLDRVKPKATNDVLVQICHDLLPVAFF